MTSLKPKGAKRGGSEEAVPDSTTTPEKDMGGFCPGQDVLLKQKDGKYYLGTVIEVDSIREQCLVKFGDNTDSWSSFKDLTKLSTPEQEDLLCVICKKSAPKHKNEISVCDKCGRGYHRECHLPEIPLDTLKEGSVWKCRRCLSNEPHHRLKKKPGRLLALNSDKDGSCSAPSTKVLPYELNSLQWDTFHRTNTELTYCYCGEDGEWYKQMLQCGRCRQWFHSKCLDCLKFPLYCGDRFYVFVCSICNQGKEFIRRIELKWVDLVHLMLFNLTVYNMKKYYDLDTIIIPYINDNWHALQLPPKIQSVKKSERRDNILSALTINRNRFKCGREIKKRTAIWGLRVRLPPPVPAVNLPSIGRVSEHELKLQWQSNKRLHFVPMPGKNDGIVIDNKMLGLMMGLAYQQPHNPSEETDSPCPSPEGPSSEEQISLLNKEIKLDGFSTAGCAKKTVSVSYSSINFQMRKRFMSVSGREKDQDSNNSKDRVLKRLRRRHTNDGLGQTDDHETGGYPTRLSLDNKTFRSQSESLPLTPPNSVSAPPTPPASGSTSLLSDLSNDFSEQSNIKNNQVGKLDSGEPNTPCDTSGDETSSKSTLDLIIPPPKDFEGKNNPFITLLRGNSSEENKKRKDSITLPLPLTAVIPGKPVMRPTKRQLSEKDIFIGPNGEVKRRRLRRNRTSQVSYTTGQTASKTATIVPARPEMKDWGQRAGQAIGGCVDYAFNGRRLRQRPDKNIDKDNKNTAGVVVGGSTQTTPKPSPVKPEPDINMVDLKSSVNIYFGAANRIAAGERFAVKAKRIGPEGKLEFLIEWEGPPTGMT